MSPPPARRDTLDKSSARLAPGEHDASPESSTGQHRRFRLEVLSTDGSLIAGLRALLLRENVAVSAKSLAQATSSGSDREPTAWLVDLRRDETMITAITTMRHAHPRSSIIALVDETVGLAEAYAAGATAVVDADPATIAACLSSVERHQDGAWAIERFAEGLALSFHQLRRLIQDSRARLVSTSVSQDVLSLLSESVERAVFFLVDGASLKAAGAFGQTPAGQHLAERTRGLQLQLPDAGVLGDCARSGQACIVEGRGANLPAGLVDRIGWPKAGLAAVFPVSGADGVVAIVYADNGDRNWPIEEMEFLELAVEHIGLAVENELLRRRAARDGGNGAGA